MNNLTIGGIDSRNGQEFSYYETVAGGMGARPALDGMSGVHTHMTNSLNTPAEALEYAYPLRVREYRLLEAGERFPDPVNVGADLRAVRWLQP